MRPGLERSWCSTTSSLRVRDRASRIEGKSAKTSASSEFSRPSVSTGSLSSVAPVGHETVAMVKRS